MTTVSFYVKAGAETGYGHIVRCIALADELKRRGCYCAFFCNNEAGNRVIQAGFDVVGFSAVMESNFPSDVWIVDLEGGCPPELAERLRDTCVSLVILNGVGYPDGDPGRLLADLVFYQGVTQRPDELSWDGFIGSWYAGIEWLIIRDSFLLWRNDSIVRAMIHQPDLPPHVVVCAGGSDPKNITQFVMSFPALAGFKGKIRIIVGPDNHNPIGIFSADVDNVNFVRDPENMAREIAWANVAVVSYGMTAFECLCLGIPTVALSISPDHAASAALVQEQSGGALVSLGEVENVPPVDIRNAVDAMLANAPALSQKARQYVDGKGVYRVADKIMETLEAKQCGTG